MLRTSYLSFGLLLICFETGYAADRPAGFVTLCTSNDAGCTLNTTTNVAFGRDNRFTYKVLTGDFACNEKTFGSSAQPRDGVYECSIPSSRAASRSTYSGPAHSSPGNYRGPEVSTPAASST